jgi:lipoprotein-releasing system permease protein
LNLYYFISKRISKAEKSSFSATIHTVSVASIALGLATMIVAFLILFGFRSVIRDKLVSFGAHFQITRFSLTNSFERDPISVNEVFIDNAYQADYIDHIQNYAYKAGLLRTEDEVYGVIIKGVGEDFAFDRFSQNMVAGEFINFPDSGYSNDVVMSRKIANALQLDTSDNVIMVFVQDGRTRYRRLDIRGIYDTGMEEFDDRIILGDLKMIQRLNDWPDTLVGGVEIFIKDFTQLDRVEDELFDEVGYNLYVEKITDQYREVFDWLSLINQNVYIFLGIILFVACFNMISALLILIMERTQMIGILKAVGAANRQIRKIFMANGLLLIGKGLLWGNIIGIGFGAMQYYFRVFPLDPENYYMSYVPIEWNFLTIFLLNLLTLTIVGSALLIPTFIISRISPIKSIRFD